MKKNAPSDATSAAEWGVTLLLILLAVINVGNLRNFLHLAGGGPADWPFPSGIPYPDLTFASGLLTLCCVLLAAATAFSRKPLRWQTLFVLAVTALTVLLPSAAHIIIRHETGDLRFTHDGGVLYIEEAISFLQQGDNPYVRSYAATSVEKKFAADSAWAGWPFQPILNFLPYLPLPFVLGFPLRLLLEPIFGFFDQRMLYLPLILVLLIIFPRLFPMRWRPAAIGMFFLNPLISVYFVQGTNDILLLFWLILGFRSLQKKHTLRASACFGLAAATKQFAWFAWPFLFALWMPKENPIISRLRVCLWRCGPGAALLAAAILPFLIWAPREFIEDTVLFNFGVLGSFYPFGGTPGYGFANLLLATGIVPSVHGEFPLWIFQLTLTAPLMALGLLRTYRQAAPSAAALYSALTLFVFLFFSRMFHYNYFGVLIAMFLTGAGLALGEEQSGEPSQ